MKPSISVANRKQNAAFRIVGLMLAIAPLCLMLVAANTSAYGQMSDDASNSSTAAASSPADWIEFHRDNMQRWNPFETAIGVNNAASLGLKWKNPIGGYGGGLESSPAVVNGVMYFGSDDSNVYALNASTGAKLWSFTTVSAVESSPAVVNGVVYIGAWGHVSGGNISGGNVYALNASTGAKLWSFTTGSVVQSSPAVANGVVYIGAQGDFGDNLFALNASTGALLWTSSDPHGGSIVSSPAVANGVVYFGSHDGTVNAVNAGTGALLWSSPVGANSSPAVANGVVYVEAGNIYALNASTGALIWSNTTVGGGAGSPSPAVANGVVYIGSSDGNVYALNASTGAKLWSYAVGNNPISSPSVVDGVVYLRVGDQSGGNLYAFSVGADLFLRIFPSTTTVHQGDLLTFAFPVWNLGPNNGVHEVLNTQVPAGTTFDYIRISGTPGLGTCTHPRYQGTGQIVCHENSSMAPNTTWTVRVTVRVTAPAGTVITENAATMADTIDPNLANNKATVSIKVQ